jgi:hypothetical protein
MMDKDRPEGKIPGGESRSAKINRQAAEKQKRLAEALRVNLHRRKAQSRARIDGGDADDGAAGMDPKGTDGTPSSS